MPTNPLFDEYFKQAAERLAQNKNITPKNVFAGYKPVTGEQVAGKTEDSSLAGNLGQGLIDVLSAGSYAVAGIGQRVGESVDKLRRGDYSNILVDLLPPVAAAAGAVSGIQNRRTWSDNLKDLGADQGTASAAGLGLDILLDPLWLVPAGAIAKGVTGTARGIQVASKLSKEGVKLTPEAVKGVQATTEGFVRPGLRNLPKQTGDLGPLADVLKPTGQKISPVSGQGLQNLYQGIKQSNIENYSEWLSQRYERKINKLQRKIDKVDQIIADIPAQSPEGLPSLLPFANEAEQATETVVKAVDDKITKQTVPNEIKDAGTEQDLIEATARKGKKAAPTPKKEKAVAAVKAAEVPVERIPKQAIYTRSAETLSPYRAEWQKRMELDVTNIDYAAIKASKDAPEMAKIYDELVSDPTNPAVQSTYAKFIDEARQQYEYLTKELGIKVEYVKKDPYNVLKFDENGDPIWQKDKNGNFVLDKEGNKVQESVPDSRLMMRDILENKTLKVRDSEIDFAEDPHPLLTVEENNIFRAVHDFFGHAASGRGFDADGEEAAWVAHSSMFSPEARRAMTTETRGQNSYYNFFDPENKQFAEQKAALFPEEYTLLPSELDLVTGQAITTNTFFGRLTNALSEFSDYVLDDLGLVQTPIKGQKLYTPAEIEKIKNTVDEIVSKEVYAPNTPVHKEIVGALTDLIQKLNAPIVRTGFVENIKNFKTKGGKSLELLQQVLDEPIIATSLLKDLAKAEGRELAAPAAFKPTYWGIKNGKTDFKVETLSRYFPDDELLSDPKKLGIAMGTIPMGKAKIYARKGETQQQAYQRYQATIWEDFRARNLDRMQEVADAQKADWDLKWQQADSEIFTETSAGQLVGIGKLPENLPFSVLTGSFNGQPTTTLGRLLENIGSLVTRAPSRAVPGTAGSTLSGGVGEIGKVFTEPAFLKNFDINAPKTPEGLVRIWEQQDINQELSKAQQLKLAKATLDADEGNLALAMDSTSFSPDGEFMKVVKQTKAKGAEFAVVDKSGERISGLVTAITSGKKLPAGTKLIAVNDAAQKVLKTLRKNKPEIEVDTLNPIIKNFMIGNLSDIIFKINKKGVTDLMSGMTKADVEANAQKLLSTGVVKSYVDARLAISGGADALRALASKPAMKLYVKDRAQLRATSSMGKRQIRQIITRDPATGLPIDKNGKIVTEGKAPVVFPGAGLEQMRMVTSAGTDFTGRVKGAGSKYAEQTGTGKQQLAAIQAVRESIANINTGIKAKEFLASPEQAKLLTNVMVSLGIKVADDIAPEAVFKQFQKEAAPAFDDMINKIQSAAKTEAVVYQARAVFNKSISDNITLMKAIDAVDPGELQRKVVQFTEDAITLVDDFCAARYSEIGGPRLSATEFLQQIAGGSVVRNVE